MSKTRKNELAALGNALGVKIQAAQVWLPSNVAAPKLFSDDATVVCQILGDHHGDGLPSWRIVQVSGAAATKLRCAANFALCGTHKYVCNPGWFDVVTWYGKMRVK